MAEGTGIIASEDVLANLAARDRKMLAGTAYDMPLAQE